MLEFQRHVSLLDKNTLSLPAKANFYYYLTEMADIEPVLKQARDHNLPLWILGGGSNILIPQHFDGLMLHIGLKGISVLKETDDAYWVNAKAGEIWDDFLAVCMENGWHGLDNLAIIPGTVGAAPVQNIGAYGQEVSDCITHVNGIDVQSHKAVTLTKAQCQFGYRDSIFKQSLQGRFIITSVDFCFKKNNTVKLDYAPLKQHFSGTTATFSDVRRAVIGIRQNKLPSPEQLANCGSFFKSPIVDNTTLHALLSKYPDMPFFEWQAGAKLAAGWLIEQCGWKGKRQGEFGVYSKHALVIVHYGGGTYSQLKQLIDSIQQTVKQKFNLVLEQEPIQVSHQYRVN